MFVGHIFSMPLVNIISVILRYKKGTKLIALCRILDVYSKALLTVFLLIQVDSLLNYSTSMYHSRILSHFFWKKF